MEAEPAPVKDAAVTLLDMANGRWSVEWWDTLEGKRVAVGEAAAANGALRLEPPPFRVDIAARLRK